MLSLVSLFAVFLVLDFAGFHPQPFNLPTAITLLRAAEEQKNCLSVRFLIGCSDCSFVILVLFGGCLGFACGPDVLLWFLPFA